MSNTSVVRGDWITEYGDSPTRDPGTSLRGRHLIPIEEAAHFYGVSPRTARRWAAEYLASGGEHGIPVIQVTERRRLVVVALMLEALHLPNEGCL
ncbi:MAG: hypothetical protein WD739_11615 [Actinomycetota bacterium]